MELRSEMLQFHWLSKEEFEEARNILKLHWQYSNYLLNDNEFLNWYICTNPLGSTGFLTAHSNGKLAGFELVTFFSVSVFGQKLFAASPTMVKSIDKVLGDVSWQLNEIAVNSVTPIRLTGGANMRSLKAWVQAGLTEFLPNMPRWWYIVSERKVRQIYKSAGKEWNFAVGTRAVAEPLEWREWEPGEAWDETFEKVLAPQIIGTWKDTQYMNWRYVIHPRFKYHIKVPPSGKGLIVYRIAEILNEDREPTGWKAVRIVDFLVDPEEGVGMGARLVAEAEKEGCAFIDFYCSGVKFGQPLQEAGFSVGEVMLPSLFSPLDFEFRPVSYGIRIPGVSVHDPRLYITRSDADQDRPN